MFGIPMVPRVVSGGCGEVTATRTIRYSRIQFWYETGGGLDEAVIQELLDRGYRIRRNGVSNYTLNKRSRVVFVGELPDSTDDVKSTKDIPSWKRMCYCILKNDHICRFMGFGLTREQQRHVNALKREYAEVVERKAVG